MAGLFEAIAVALFVTVAAGLVRVLRGPERFDRMLAAQLFGTGGVALLVLLSVSLENRALLDVALVSALLAALAGLAFIRLGGRR